MTAKKYFVEDSSEWLVDDQKQNKNDYFSLTNVNIFYKIIDLSL